MKLSELLRYDDIVIQGHDNPDADAVASGYGLYLYLLSHGKRPRLIYGGPNEIGKSNLVMMVKLLDIPIEHVQELAEPPQLLVTVDCQYGERNVQMFAAETTAVIDHHMAIPERLPALQEVRDNYGACATVLWDMMTEEGFDAAGNEKLSTAFYYGLFMDTGKMQELRHPKDKDMRDELEFRCSKAILTLLQNRNLSRNELRIAGDAMADVDYAEDRCFTVVEARRCDPNILGIISDALIEVDTVNTCVVFCVLDDGVKLSVRSCEPETRADELAAFISAGVGSGGGHMRKAGGFLMLEPLMKEYTALYGPAETAPGQAVQRFLSDRMTAYYRDQDLITSDSDSVPDLTGAPLYEKKRLPIGYVRATDMYPAGTPVSVRMLEGDISFTIREDTYFIIGVEGEVYKNDEAYFLSHNDPLDEPYQIRGEYAPTVHTAVQTAFLDPEAARQKSLQDYVRTCIPKEHSRVHAIPLTRRTKVFVSWSDSYMLGNVGDYLAARAENPRKVYIIRREIMEKSYEPVSDSK